MNLKLQEEILAESRNNFVIAIAMTLFCMYLVFNSSNKSDQIEEQKTEIQTLTEELQECQYVN